MLPIESSAMISQLPCPTDLVLLPNHVLSHFEGAEVLVHVLDVRIIGGILVTVQQPCNGFVVIVDDTAVLLFVLSCSEVRRRKGGRG